MKIPVAIVTSRMIIRKTLKLMYSFCHCSMARRTRPLITPYHRRIHRDSFILSRNRTRSSWQICWVQTTWTRSIWQAFKFGCALSKSLLGRFGWRRVIQELWDNPMNYGLIWSSMQFRNWRQSRSSGSQTLSSTAIWGLDSKDKVWLIWRLLKILQVQDIVEVIL